MESMRIEAYRSAEKPDLMILARYLLPMAREFYQNPENDRKFQEWKERRKSNEQDKH